MPDRSAIVRQVRGTAIPLAIFVLALIGLHKLGGEFHLRDVLAAFADIEPRTAAVAVGLAVASYLALTASERLALGYVRASLTWARYGLTAFIANAIGNGLGVAAISGGAVRFRLYGAMGLGGADIARVIAFCAATFAIGVATLAGASLIALPGEGATLLHASASVSKSIGAALLVVVAVYVAACGWSRSPVAWSGWSVQLPPVRLAIGQVLVATADLLLACACLFVLLPSSAGISYLAFAGPYMVALAAGAVTAVPGGLGVFESVLVMLLPAVPVPQLLGALLAYRLVYYVLPFGVALLLLSAREANLQRERLGRAFSWTHKALGLVVPQAMAMLVFGAGFVLLLSGATPGATTRLAALHRVLPLSVLEFSHLAGSAVGVLLLILARSLARRLDGAWYVTTWLLGAGIVASLLKGLDFEEAAVLATALLALLITRGQFYRKASLLSEPTPRWLANAAMAVGASIWVGLLAYRHVPYGNELWWQFALDGHAPRMLRASLLAVLLLGSFSMLRLLAPVRVPLPRPTAAELERALPIVRASPESSAHLAMLGDKALLFSDTGRAFLMYGVSRRSWVAMGDPVGAPNEREELVWRFRDLADRAGAWSVFYQVSAEQLPIYIDAGLALSKLGEEARVPLGSFSLDGSSRAELRQVHRRAGRDGLAFRIVPAASVATLMPDLQRVSDDWLDARATAEKGFSLGRFEESYMRRFPVAVVERSSSIVAFANVWESDVREELSVDLMRHSRVAPASSMDFLFVELMLWGRSVGFQWFNLGMAPLAGLDEHRLAPTWHKVGRFVYRHGEDFYNFAGLRKFKEKFYPQWRPRYLAAPGRLALPRVLFDVTTLISGGVSATLRKDDAPGVAARSQGA